MPRSAAGNQEYPVDAGDIGGSQIDIGKTDLAVLRVDPAAYGVGDGLGLLEDLLEHEMLEPGLLGHGGAPEDGLGFPHDFCTADQRKYLPAAFR